MHTPSHTTHMHCTHALHTRPPAVHTPSHTTHTLTHTPTCCPHTLTHFTHPHTHAHLLSTNPHTLRTHCPHTRPPAVHTPDTPPQHTLPASVVTATEKHSKLYKKVNFFLVVYTHFLIDLKTLTYEHITGKTFLNT